MTKYQDLKAGDVLQEGDFYVDIMRNEMTVPEIRIGELVTDEMRKILRPITEACDHVVGYGVNLDFDSIIFEIYASQKDMHDITFIDCDHCPDCGAKL